MRAVWIVLALCALCGVAAAEPRVAVTGDDAVGVTAACVGLDSWPDPPQPRSAPVMAATSTANTMGDQRFITFLLSVIERNCLEGMQSCA